MQSIKVTARRLARPEDINAAPGLRGTTVAITSGKPSDIDTIELAERIGVTSVHMKEAWTRVSTNTPIHAIAVCGTTAIKNVRQLLRLCKSVSPGRDEHKRVVILRIGEVYGSTVEDRRAYVADRCARDARKCAYRLATYQAEGEEAIVIFEVGAGKGVL